MAQLTERLAQAPARGELSLVYQPLVDTRTFRLQGVEALLRWTDAQIGPVPPAEFIPLAERTGLIHTLGKWVLQRACAEFARSLPRVEQPVFLSVNVSVRQLEDPSFPLIVADALARASLPPEQLHLEITESSWAERWDVLQRSLSKLRELGVQFSLDDFGSGYSSLSVFRRLPLDMVKLDREFAHELEGERDPIVRAVVTLAHALRRRVVAEGVETAVQANTLCLLGCDMLQGYWVSPPAPARQLREWLARPARIAPADPVRSGRQRWRRIQRKH